MSHLDDLVKDAISGRSLSRDGVRALAEALAAEQKRATEALRLAETERECVRGLEAKLQRAEAAVKALFNTLAGMDACVRMNNCDMGGKHTYMVSHGQRLNAAVEAMKAALVAYQPTPQSAPSPSHTCTACDGRGEVDMRSSRGGRGPVWEPCLECSGRAQSAPSPFRGTDLSKIVGKWPGDETEAELLEGLKQSAPQAKAEETPS